MTQASKLRTFSSTAEFVSGLMSKLSYYKVISKNEADLLAKRLRDGAEAALDIAAKMERPAETSEVLGSLKDLIRITEAVRYSAGLGKTQMERVERAKEVAARAEAS